MRDSVFGGEEGALGVYVNDAVPLLRAGVLGSLADTHTSIVDEHIEPAETSNGLLDKSLDFFLARHVHLDEHGLTAVRCDALNDGRAAYGIHVGDDNPGPFPGEDARNPFPNAGTGPGDNRHLVIQSASSDCHVVRGFSSRL